MANPWEQYGSTQSTQPAGESTEQGPWAQFGSQATAAEPVQTATPVATSVPAASTAPAPWEQYSKPQEGEEKSSPRVWSDITSDQDLQQIATKHNVPVSDLKDVAAFFGATTQGDTNLKDAVLQVAGSASKIAAFGLPQKLYKIIQTPKMEGALDDLSDLAEEKKSTLREGTEIAGSLVGGVMGLGALGKAAYPAIGAVAGFAGAKQNDEAKSALTGAAFGAGMGVLGKYASNVIGKHIKDIEAGPIVEYVTKIKNAIQPSLDAAKTLLTGEQTVADLADKELIDFLGPRTTRQALESGSAVNNLAKDASQATNQRELLEHLAENKLEDLKGQIEKVAGGNKDFTDLKKQGQVESLFDRLVNQDLYSRAADQVGKPVTDMNPVTQLLLKFNDSRSVGKIIDKRLGTDVAQIIDEGSGKLNQATTAINALGKEIDALEGSAKKAGINVEDLSKYLSNPEEAAIPRGVSKEFLSDINVVSEKIQNVASDFGNKATIEGVPQYRKPTVDYIRAVEQQLDTIGSKYGIDNLKTLDQAQFGRLKEASGTFGEVLGELENVAGTPITSAKAFNGELNKLLTNFTQTRSRLAELAGNPAPDWALENNPFTALRSHAANSIKTGAITDTVQKLGSAKDLAVAAGDSFSSNYLGTLMQDIKGTRESTLPSGLTKWSNKFDYLMKQKADDASNPISKALYNGAGKLPEFLNFASQQIYPNLIGWNPRSVFLHVATPFVHALPDVGVDGQYGATKLAQAAADLAKIKTVGTEITLSPGLAAKLGKKAGEVIKTTSLEDVLANEGVLSTQLSRDSLNEMRDGILKGTSGSLPRKALDAVNDLSLAAFKNGERASRGLTYFLGRNIGEDLVRNPMFAKDFINKLSSSSYRKALSQAVVEKDSDEAARLMGQYLNANSSLNFGKINMSEFGRNMGPLFSAFTRWPTAVTGRITSDIYDKGWNSGGMKAAQVYLAPWAILEMVDKGVIGTDPTGQKSPRLHKLIGSGLADVAPVSSVFGQAERGGPISSPFISAVGNTAKALVAPSGGPNTSYAERLGNAAGKTLDNWYTTFGFGSNVLKLIGEDIPTYVSGRKVDTAPYHSLYRLENIADMMDDHLQYTHPKQ